MRITWSDALVAAFATVIAVAGEAITPSQPGFRDPDAIAAVIAGALGVPLLVRRSHPGPVLTTVGIGTATFFVLGYPPTNTALIAILVAVYSYGVHAVMGRRLAGAAFTALVVAVVLTTTSLRSGPLYAGEVAAVVLVFVTAWVLGDRTRHRRAYLRSLEARAKDLADQRRQQAAVAVAAERTRIARELHDVVAHAVSVIVLHARGAKEVIADDPGLAHRSLDLIEETGRQALTELRTVLVALRTGDEGVDRSMHPQPGLEGLERLTKQTTDAGLAVELETEGQPGPVPTAIAMSVYRIVQEALTNVLTHSTAARARVVLRYGPGDLLVQVTDDGDPRHSARTGGHGLVGMRERVALFGGQFTAGPRRDGGYEVLAVLPMDGNRQ